MSTAQVLLPELSYVDGALRPDVAVVVSADGRIVELAPRGKRAGTALPGRALFPGLVNAHSHAFQRLLRGRTEWRAAGGDDFWTWRDRMYAVAGALSPEQVEDVSAFAFLEMAKAGITSVGEFHYLHHDPRGRPYGDPTELSQRVIRAARRVGLRIVLLRGAYARGGMDRALEGVQRRFALGNLESFVAATEALEHSLRGDRLASVGLAPHSVRALHRDQLRVLGEAAQRYGWPVHMHLAEQPREVDACVAETGLGPVELAHACGLLTPRFCAVHAIHIKRGVVKLLGQAKAAVCACPTTERDLGDGVIPAGELRRAGVTLALGTDSQVQIDLLEDARSLEQNLRLFARQRVLLDPSEEQPAALARTLFAAATEGGARALGLPAAALAEGSSADFFAVDLADPSLVGRAEDLLPTLVFGGHTRAITDVMVDGRFVVRDRRHVDEEAITARYRAVAEGL